MTLSREEAIRVLRSLSNSLPPSDRERANAALEVLSRPVSLHPLLLEMVEAYDTPGSTVLSGRALRAWDAWASAGRPHFADGARQSAGEVPPTVRAILEAIDRWAKVLGDDEYARAVAAWKRAGKPGLPSSPAPVPIPQEPPRDSNCRFCGRSHPGRIYGKSCERADEDGMCRACGGCALRHPLDFECPRNKTCLCPLFPIHTEEKPPVAAGEAVVRIVCSECGGVLGTTVLGTTLSLAYEHTCPPAAGAPSTSPALPTGEQWEARFSALRDAVDWLALIERTPMPSHDHRSAREMVSRSLRRAREGRS